MRILKVCDRLGIDDSDLPRLVVGDGQHYTEMFDFESIDIVSKNYREEIKRFNFEFGQ